ncbi:unnamed protein product [Oppiella nova]|uniref:DUF4604 domain-containing protein n=1 Tax=Oppiella nova TaxID=334625 RepID=A0A7R9Q993_9ACAR|nr:unnamed protein product [Oppiella nova]CAG2159384.1 unnamed protein product [Oppiella nova]
MANRKRNISFAKPEEPDFIKKLKAKHGITAGPDVDTKREVMPRVDSDDLEDRDEEQPVIVVLKDGDLDEEEVKRITDENQLKQEETDIKEGKIIFKKPDKSETNDQNQSLLKSKSEKESIRQRLQSNETKSVRNSSLLSFGDEEDDEEDSD